MKPARVSLGRTGIALGLFCAIMVLLSKTRPFLTRQGLGDDINIAQLPESQKASWRDMEQVLAQIRPFWNPLLGSSHELRFMRDESSVQRLCEANLPPSVVRRHSSFPFVTGDTFRDIADCVVDETGCPMDMWRCNFTGAIVAVKTDFEADWFSQYHRAMAHPYVLVTFNSDYPAPFSTIGERVLRSKSPKLLKWFGQNVRYGDDKTILPIPIGTNNVGIVNGDLVQMSNLWGKHDPLHDTIARWEAKLAFEPNASQQAQPFNVMFLFSIDTNPEVRQQAHDDLIANGFRPSPSGPYLDTVRNVLMPAHFSISPFGNGMDCVRNMESILAGVIPIMMDGPLNRLWHGLPHVLVDSYKTVTPDFLREQFVVVKQNWKQGKYNMQKAFAPYWMEQIYRAAGRLQQ